MKLPQKTLERKLLKIGYDFVVGVDEVGMGCLAGPVVVCAVCFAKDFYEKNYPELRGLQESKLLSAIQREKFAEELLKNKNLKFKICYAYPKTIDKLNIYQASRLAMKKAIQKLKPKLRLDLNLGFTISEGFSFAVRRRKVRRKKENPSLIVLVDGNKRISGLSEEQMPIVKGDRKIFVIACASIIAKVYRDKMMTRYAKKFPGYGFEKHKGYGTKHHQAQLVAFGPCEIHRRSFAPVAKLL